MAGTFPAVDTDAIVGRLEVHWMTWPVGWLPPELLTIAVSGTVMPEMSVGPPTTGAMLIATGVRSGPLSLHPVRAARSATGIRYRTIRDIVVSNRSARLLGGRHRE